MLVIFFAATEDSPSVRDENPVGMWSAESPPPAAADTDPPASETEYFPVTFSIEDDPVLTCETEPCFDDGFDDEP